MYRTLGRPQGRQFWTSRGLAVAGIVVVHALMLSVVLLRGAKRVEQESVPIAVSLSLDVPRPVAAPPPSLPVRMESLAVDAVPVPELTIDLPQEATPVLVAARSEPKPMAPPAETRADTGAPLPVSEVEYLRPPVPRYPVAARRAQQQGVVYVRVLVDEGGRARDVQVSRSSGFDLLDEAARQCVREALFKPFSQNGVARSVVVVVPVAFTLQRQVANR